MRYDDFLRGAAYLKETGLTVRPLLRTQGTLSPTLAAQLAASEAAVEVNDGEALQALAVRCVFLDLRAGGESLQGGKAGLQPCEEDPLGSALHLPRLLL